MTRNSLSGRFSVLESKGKVEIVGHRTATVSEPRGLNREDASKGKLRIISQWAKTQLVSRNQKAKSSLVPLRQNP